MAKFSETVRAGTRAENEVYEVLQKYTRHVYRNCRVDTLYSKAGNTEIDILAALADVLLVVEVKNVRSIEGDLSLHYWRLEGLETGQEYSTLNVLTQNRIHTRSLKDAWFARRHEFPIVMSVVVVPNGCSIPAVLRGAGVLEVRQFDLQLAALMRKYSGRAKYGYTLDYLFGKDDAWLSRPDFTGGKHG